MLPAVKLDQHIWASYCLGAGMSCLFEGLVEEYVQTLVIDMSECVSMVLRVFSG